MCYFQNFQKNAEVKNNPMGENSPNLVTLVVNHSKTIEKLFAATGICMAWHQAGPFPKHTVHPYSH
jgi:hypothetical protein